MLNFRLLFLGRIDILELWHATASAASDPSYHLRWIIMHHLQHIAPNNVHPITPWKINMEPQNEGLVQMIFLFISGGVSGSILIFRGIYMYIMYIPIYHHNSPHCWGFKPHLQVFLNGATNWQSLFEGHLSLDLHHNKTLGKTIQNYSPHGGEKWW